MMETQNAIIERTLLGYEDHGILTIWIFLQYGGSGQGYGGYALDGKPAEPHGTRVPTALVGIAVAGLLRAAGVDRWEDLKGQHVRVRREDGFNGRVLAIGHFLEDKWFSFEEAFAAHRLLEQHTHTNDNRDKTTGAAS